MKAHILFDAAGNVLAMVHSVADENSERGSRKQPQMVFRPTDKQRAATLDIPAELVKLKPSKLHKAVQVEISGGKPRIVAKKDK